MSQSSTLESGIWLKMLNTNAWVNKDQLSIDLVAPNEL